MEDVKYMNEEKGEGEYGSENELEEDEDENKDNEGEGEGEDSDGSESHSDDQDDQIQSSRQGGKQGQQQEQEQEQEHYSILLSTAIPDKRPVIIRRSDGFEKRVLLRCGRCRVVMGYVLDVVQFLHSSASSGDQQGEREKTSGMADDVIYLLPGALLRTDEMGVTGEAGPSEREREWRGWEKLVAG